VSEVAEIKTSATTVSVAELVALRKSVGKLKRRAGRRVVAPVSGSSTSAALGRGLDFSEVREYHGGDDVRLIDWKVTARTGRAHTKLFTEERERPFFIAIDLRPPMFFATRVAFKSVVAARLCAIVAWAAAAQRDRVGGLVFNNNQLLEIKPQAGSRGVTRLLHQIVKLHNSSRRGKFKAEPLSDALTRLDQIAHTGSSICLVSDFSHFDAGPHATNLLRHNHTASVQLFDPLEAELPPPAEYAITDGKRKGRLKTTSSRVRQQYREICCMAFLLINRSLKKRERDSWRTTALTEHKRISDDFLNNKNQYSTLAELSVLMRRVSLAVESRRSVAALTDDQWLQRLDVMGETTDYSSGAGRLLYRHQYQREMSLEDGAMFELFELTKNTIKKAGHHSDNQEGVSVAAL